MAQFTVNAQRFDPYKNFKFRVKWDGRYVAGVSKISALKRTTEVVKHRSNTFFFFFCVCLVRFLCSHRDRSGVDGEVEPDDGSR